MFCLHFCFVLIKNFLPRIEGRVREKSKFENKIESVFLFHVRQTKRFFPNKALCSYSVIYYDKPDFYCVLLGFKWGTSFRFPFETRERHHVQNNEIISFEATPELPRWRPRYSVVVEAQKHLRQYCCPLHPTHTTKGFFGLVGGGPRAVAHHDHAFKYRLHRIGTSPLSFAGGIICPNRESKKMGHKPWAPFGERINLLNFPKLFYASISRGPNFLANFSPKIIITKGLMAWHGTMKGANSPLIPKWRPYFGRETFEFNIETSKRHEIHATLPFQLIWFLCRRTWWCRTTTKMMLNTDAIGRSPSFEYRCRLFLEGRPIWKGFRSEKHCTMINLNFFL